MNPIEQYMQAQPRRMFLRNSGIGIGAAALSTLLPQRLLGASGGERTQTGGLPNLPHFAPKAKRVIYLFAAGGPSQVDMFDYKPQLRDRFDEDLPPSVMGDQRITTMTSGQDRFPVAPSKYEFEQVGESGAWVSELLPYTKRIMDDVTLIKTVQSDAINHDPAITHMCTGNQLPGHPSMGAWLSYGLGTENEDLPAFVVMTPQWSGRQEAQALYNRLWGSGFLPSRHQGVSLRSVGDPVLFLSNPAGVDEARRRRMLDSLQKLNERHSYVVGDPETEARISQYEMAFRMQSSVPELTDISTESQEVLDLYGPDVTTPGTFAASCLLARRMAERGVRFTQIFHRGWDQHGNVAGDLPNQCRDIDQACYGLITDLKQRGLLEDTLVIWGGEFGRTVYCQGALTKDNYGRDHHVRNGVFWMAGAGVKQGLVYGETDDYSYNVVENPVHLNDLNATILDQLGINHSRFTYRFQGADQKLTGVVPGVNPVEDILA